MNILEPTLDFNSEFPINSSKPESYSIICDLNLVSKSSLHPALSRTCFSCNNLTHKVLRFVWTQLCPNTILVGCWWSRVIWIQFSWNKLDRFISTWKKTCKNAVSNSVYTYSNFQIVSFPLRLSFSLICGCFAGTCLANVNIQYE